MSALALELRENRDRLGTHKNVTVNTVRCRFAD